MKRKSVGRGSILVLGSVVAVASMSVPAQGALTIDCMEWVANNTQIKINGACSGVSGAQRITGELYATQQKCDDQEDVLATSSDRPCQSGKYKCLFVVTQPRDPRAWVLVRAPGQVSACVQLPVPPVLPGMTVAFGGAAGEVCEDCEPIPTVSEWALVVMTLMVLVAGTIMYGRRQVAGA